MVETEHLNKSCQGQNYDDSSQRAAAAAALIVQQTTRKKFVSLA